MNSRWDFAAFLLSIVPAYADQGVSFALPPVDPVAIAAVAPVKSVNGALGNVLVPAYQRQVSSALPASVSDGSVTWTFPTTFGAMPTCWPSLASVSTTYTFDYPQLTAISTTSVSYVVSAHQKSLSISSLTLPILLQITPNAPPAGTTLTLSCLAPIAPL